MTTDYLAEVLQLAPSTWTRATYTSSNYVTENLYEYSEEYKNIVRALPSNLAERIRKVERVQHPFAYGRFVLRKEQLENRDGVKRVPTRYFLQVKENDIKEALEYNMDSRRTPFDSSNRSIDVSKCVVVVQSIVPPSNWQRDCESYPEYVVYYNNNGVQYEALSYNYRDRVPNYVDYDDDYYDSDSGSIDSDY